MSSEWDSKELGELFHLKSGSTPSKKKKNYWKGNIPWISASSMYDFFVSDSENRITEEALNSSGKLVEAGTVLLLVRGSILHQRIPICLATRPVSFNQDVKALIPKGEISSEYIFYWLRGYEKKLLQMVDETGIGAGKLDTELLERIEILLPPKNYREKVIRWIKVFDQKIQLNQQINETLEGMAQAIFKSWFVDFDPVRAKIQAIQDGQDSELAAMAAISSCTKVSADGAVLWEETMSALDQKLEAMTEDQRQQLAQTASLFPDELVDSELGEVPRGWEVVNLGSVIENFDSKRVPLSRREREKRKGSFPYYGATSIMDYVEDFLFDGIHVLMAEDGSVMDDKGKPILQYVNGKIWVNNHAHVLKGLSPVSDETLYLFLKTVDIKPYVTGAVQLKINQGNMNSIPFLKADDAILELFSELVKPSFEIRLKNEKETETLSKVRDTLLPKLISGEIEV